MAWTPGGEWRLVNMERKGWRTSTVGATGPFPPRLQPTRDRISVEMIPFLAWLALFITLFGIGATAGMFFSRPGPVRVAQSPRRSRPRAQRARSTADRQLALRARFAGRGHSRPSRGDMIGVQTNRS
jgi:hypothetical protein